MKRIIAGLMIFLAAFASEVIAEESTMSGTIDISTVEGLMQFHKLPFMGDVTETGIEMYPYRVGNYDRYAADLAAEEPFRRFFVFHFENNVVKYLELPGTHIASTIEHDGKLYGIISPSMMGGTGGFIYKNYVVNLSKGEMLSSGTDMGAAEFEVADSELYIKVYQSWSAAAAASDIGTPTTFYKLNGEKIGHVYGSYKVESNEVVTRRSLGAETCVTRLNLRSGKETVNYEPNS